MSDKIETEFNAKDNTPLKGQSIYIKASAGTGKTYNIQKIVRQLLERKDVPQLEKILIVTFTEKAAGELRDRIRKELAGFDADVDNAPIYTIHSFCQKTLEEFAFTAKKPASLELIDEEEINDFIDRAIRDGLENDENFRTELIPLFENAENKDSFIESFKDDLKQAVGRYYPDEKIVELDANSDSIYLKYEGKKEQKEWTTGDEKKKKNIIITFCDNYTLSDAENKGRQGLKNIGTMDGYYITNGKAIKIKCIKNAREEQTIYQDLEGNKIDVNDGNTFVNICPTDAKVILEAPELESNT